MCGISGYFAFSGPVEETTSLRAMNRAVAHRGPDGEGAAFIGTQTGIVTPFAGERTPLTPPALRTWPAFFRVPHDLALGHRRFAIVDRTPGGHQPFLIPDDPAASLALAFNGEIYNHVELREELTRRGHVFRTPGDVEVLARAYLEWGEACFTRLRGFWALALWDGRRDAGNGGPRGLLLARDPLGKAPLYWAARGGRLWWSSEIKGLRAGLAAAGREPFTPRGEAVALFVRAGLRDFGNQTFFEGIKTFPAASHAWVMRDGGFTPRRSWDFPQERLRASDLGIDEAVAGLSDRLEEAVRLRLRADAPVGLELSGGMDSSAIAAFAAGARRSGAAGPLDAYTVGFPGTAWDESPYARKVAGHFPGSLRLHELTPGGDSILRELADFHHHMDEPFHSPVLVSNREIWRRMAAAGIRVSLNGAGGDEVFAGYGSEYLGPYARGLIARGRVTLALRELGSFSEREGKALRDWARAAWWMVPESLRKGLRPPGPPAALDPLSGRAQVPAASDDFGRRLLDHLGDHKMNYWLRSGNTSFMGVPLEVRLPLLDVRVVEWACRLPAEYLIRDGWLKWVLRKALEPHLPREVVWRPLKMGFPFPLADWLRASRPGFEHLRRGEDPPGLDRSRVFAAYDALAASHPAYLWRCLSVLLWWEACVAGRKER
jgi:asparagine synthase (glutamine-hydrolysing)